MHQYSRNGVKSYSYLTAIAHVVAIAAAALSAYVFAYLAMSRPRLGKAATALFTVGFYNMLTVYAVAWAVPVFTTVLPPPPTTLEAQATDRSQGRAFIGTGLTPD